MEGPSSGSSLRSCAAALGSILQGLKVAMSTEDADRTRNIGSSLSTVSHLLPVLSAASPLVHRNAEEVLLILDHLDEAVKEKEGFTTCINLLKLM